MIERIELLVGLILAVGAYEVARAVGASSALIGLLIAIALVIAGRRFAAEHSQGQTLIR